MANPAADGVCDECGFDYDRVADDEVGPALRDFGRRYRMPLTRGLKDESLDDIVRAHPTPGVWSALEYACHVRDVFAVQRDRLAQALVEDTPDATPMRREERVAEMHYNEQDREVVADELAANAAALADAFDALTADQWGRTIVYHYPDPANPTTRDMRWLGVHTVHEGNHHLLDVGRVLRTARGR
jgi:hypothetical protein